MIETSIILVNYNAGKDLQECLSALEKNTRLPYEVIVVDNASQDGSLEDLETRYPKVQIMRSQTNLGYARGINLGASQAQGEFLVILNPDVIVHPDWLQPLVHFLRENLAAGAATPRILLHGKPDVLNALGQNIHLTGLGFNRKLNQPVIQADRISVRVNGIQGGAFAVPTKVFKSIGGMNESYFLYHEDVEFSLRLALAGYQIYAVPDSIVSHKYRLHMTPAKLHWLERHRWLTLLTTYQVSTLLALTPFLLLTEAMMAGYCLLRGSGYLRAKAEAVQWVLAKRELVGQIRRQTQALRRVPDRQALSGLRILYDHDQFVVLARQRGGWLLDLFSFRSEDRAS